jgi:hypothetical protein
MVVKVESIEILGEVGEQAQTAQIVWEGHFFKAM